MSFRRASFIATIFFALTHLIMFAYMDWPVALLSTLLAVASSIPLDFQYEYGNKTVWSPAIAHTTMRTVGLVVATEEKQFAVFSLNWIVACMVIPYIVLVFLE